MRALDVVEGHVFHVVGYVGWVAERPDGRAPGFVAVHIFHLDVGAVAFDGDAVLLWVLGGCFLKQGWGDGLTSPQVTVQLLMKTSFEFQVSVPSVLTVLHWLLLVEFMSRFVMVTFSL